MKRYLAITIALVGFGAIASADTFSTVTALQQSTSPTWDIIDWGDNAGGQSAPYYGLTSPLAYTSFNGNTGTVTNASGADMAYVQDGNGWAGNFDFGANALWNQNFNTDPADGLIVTFSSPLNSVGFELDANYYGTFTGQLEVFDASHTLLDTLTLGGLMNGNGDGSALFMGLMDDSGANIYSIDIQTYNSIDTNDFAIDDITMTSDSSSVPEPGSVFLLASVVLGVAGLLRRRLSGESA